MWAGTTWMLPRLRYCFAESSPRRLFISRIHSAYPRMARQCLTANTPADFRRRAEGATLLDTVRRAAAQLFIPFAVGGGIRSLEDAAAVFAAGADKISINSAALADPELITQIAKRFGSQAVVVAIDAKRGVNGSGWE